MARRMAELVLGEAERTELKLLSSRRKTAQALALRARIVLECARGLENQEVAASLGIAKNTVGKWRRRFVERGMDGLHDEARSGAPRSIEDDRIEAVIVKTLESLPENATHWSSRGMAKASGLSVSSVQRIWRAFGLQPHRMESFKLSTDPDFRRQSTRRRRALRGAARACGRALRRREEPNPGVGSQPAHAADAARPGCPA